MEAVQSAAVLLEWRFMMAPRVLVLFAIGLFFSSAFADTSVAPNRFAFTNVTVIDSENGVRTDQT